MEDIYIVPNFHSNIKYYLKDKFSWKGDMDAGGWAMSKTFIQWKDENYDIFTAALDQVPRRVQSK